jgi:hypothetical protein
MKQNYDIDGVDMVTFPGADGLFSNGNHSEEIALIRRAVSISIALKFSSDKSFRTKTKFESYYYRVET